MKIYTLAICDIQSVGFGCPTIYNFTDNAMAFKKMEECFISKCEYYDIKKSEIDEAMSEDTNEITTRGLMFGHNYCYISDMWYADIIETELCEETYNPKVDEITKILNHIFLSGYFKDWKIEINCEVVNDFKEMEFIWITDALDKDNHNYAILKYGDYYYIPLGDEDCYPISYESISRYTYSKVDNKGEALAAVGFDRMYTELLADKAIKLWEYEDKVGEGFYPNRYWGNNEYYTHLKLETELCEFTMACYEKYKNHIDGRDAFTDYIIYLTKKFIEIYDGTLFGEGDNWGYYECVDNFISIHDEEAKRWSWYYEG